MTLGEVAQCAVAALVGCAVWAGMDGVGAGDRERTIAAVALGVTASWVGTFVYVWARFGWRAARSMSMTP